MKKSDQEECVLCCIEISIYAVGACDHPVCYKCSARMRVLCETNECPICRSEMPVVICTYQRRPFTEISDRYSLIDKKYQVIFANNKIQESFLELLENKCKVCNNVFYTFNKLRDHVRREHNLQYCELCAENLKIFPFERKTYDRKELARHKRIGDPDETSHRGHPLCEFCDQRYIDTDELFRHLRREHYFCHFCDADGLHQYYEDYHNLKVHFREEHYLCEEGNCANEQFVGAFRTEIDLKAHIAVHHSKNKSKAEARQARMLEFEFTYAPPHRTNANSSPRSNRFKQHQRQNAEENSSKEIKTSQAEKEKIDTQSTLEFPYLSEDAENSSVVPNTNLQSMTLQSFSRNSIPQRHKNAMSVEDFPALVSTTVSVTSETNNLSRKFNFSIHRQNNMPVKTPNVSIHLAQKNAQSRNIEPNSKETETKKQKPTWISKKNNTTFEDEFPKLETKKPSVTYTNVVNTTVVNVQNKPQSAIEVVSNSQGGSGDQFIIIKQKSRKKKQNKAAYKDDTDEKGDASNTFNSLLLNNNHFNLLEEEDINEKFRKNLFRPDNTKANYIEDDTWQQKVSFGKDDFPPLAAPSNPIRRPPGFSRPSKKPPPGFSVNSQSNENSTAVNISLSSIARQIVGSDVNKSVETKIPRSDWKYKKPYNFNTRNNDLACKIKELSSFEEFRTNSLAFRNNQISAATYYSECLKILDEKEFLDIFPELITLLPDINKQQELYEVHKKYQNNSGAVPKQKLLNNIISVCGICYQVLLDTDYQNHISEHGTDFMN